MGFFDYLKDLFSGWGRSPSYEGLYIYVRLDKSGEVVQLRLNPVAELNADSERGGYVCRKHITGPMTFDRAEATFYFDRVHRLTGADIVGGELAAQEDWLAQLESGSSADA
jgi:hypothetical protein